MILQRVALLETWKSFEETHGTPEDVSKVQSMMPIVSKRRHVDQETGQTVEDWDLVFADDEREANPTSFKFLQMAHAWKAAKQGGGGGGSASGMLAGFVAGAPSAAPPKKEEARMDEDEKSDAASSHSGDDD